MEIVKLWSDVGVSGHIDELRRIAIRLVVIEVRRIKTIVQTPFFVRRTPMRFDKTYILTYRKD